MADTVNPDTGSSPNVVVTVVAGTPKAGTIETAGDEDWYRLTTIAAHTYTVSLMGLGNGADTLADPLIQGIFTTGEVYFGGFNNDGLIAGPFGRDATTTFTATGTSYWIATAGDSYTTGTYTLSVVDSSIAGGTDVLATTATISNLAAGTPVTGTIDTATDVDWYRVVLTAGASYTFRARGLPSASGTLADPVIAGLYDSNGNYIVNTYVDDIGTRDAALTLVAPNNGSTTFYIAVDGWSTYTGTYSVDFAAATADIPGSTSSTATLVVGAASTTVDIGQPYDHDWYGATLTAGTTYQYSMSGTGSNNTPGIHGIFSSTGGYLGGYAAAILGSASTSTAGVFVPTVSGTYFIDAYSIYEGTYSLSISQVASDVPNNVSTTAVVAVDGSVTGDIGGATDIDWHKVSLVNGSTYVIKMQGEQSGFGTLADTIIAGIYNSSGVLIPNTFADDSDGNEASLVFRPSANGDYYIAADGYASYTGTYKLSVTSIAGDVGQTTATATSMLLNTPTSVTIDDAADVDWYSVVLTSGVAYGIRLQGAATQRGTLYDPVLKGVYDSAGALLADTFIDDAGGLLNAKLAYTPTSTGTYYIATDGYDRFTGTMRLAVTFDNIGAVNATAGALAVNGSTEGVIDLPGDTDRYAIALEASETYYIQMLGSFSHNGDLADPSITAIRDTAGAAQTITAITNAITIGLDSWVKITTAAGTAGTYYVDTASGAGLLDGDFLLTAEKDIPGGTTTTATVTVGGSVTGLIGDGTDNDWYSVALNTNTSYVIKMLGFDSGNGTLADPNIDGVRLSTTSTTKIAGTFGTGTTVDNAVLRDSVARFIPAANGTYYIAADSTGGAMGSFILSVATEVGNTIATASTLAVGGSVIGTIDDTPDIDWYKIPLLNNTSYIFKMLGTDSGNGTLDDPLIARILASNGTTSQTTGLVKTNVGLDSVARWTSNASADFYIEATGAGTDTGTFLLTAEAEVGSTTASAGSIAVGGSVTGKLDDTSDADWYSVDLAAGTRYRVRMEGASSGNGTLADPLINGIHTSAGAVITVSTGSAGVTENGAGGVSTDAYAIFTNTTAGTYYIYADATPAIIGTYTLSVELWP